MNFTYNINFVNKARNEHLYNSENTSRNNVIFVRSYYKYTGNTQETGTRTALTLQGIGDKKWGRDSSQHTRVKKASSGNAYVGNK
jgi:hypothetical protein